MSQTSDTDLEMAASATFSSILNEIQLSNLNFKIEMTPFAAIIILKKSVLRDKNGYPAIPSPPILSLLQQSQLVISILRDENAQLKASIQNKEEDAGESIKVRGELKVKLEEVNCELGESVDRTNNVLKEAEMMAKKLHRKDDQIATLESATRNLTIETENLKSDIKLANKSAKALEKEVSRLNVKNDNLLLTVKNNKAENKVLETEKNKAVKEKVKLEKKLSDTKLSKSVQTKSTNTNIYTLTSRSTNTSSWISKTKGTNTTNCSDNKSTNPQSSLLCETKTSSTALDKNSGMPDLSKESSSCTMPPLLTAASSTSYLESIQDVNKQSTENIAEQFEEFLEHFQATGAASKYSLLATDLVTSAGRILDVRITDVKSYSKSLNESIDLCYKKAFPQMCTGLRNFIRKNVDSDTASKDFLVRLVI